MSERRATEAELADEARRWDARELTPAGWADAPAAVPRADEAVAVSLRLPRRMVDVLTEFARRQGVSYPVLVERWLNDRIRHEHEQRREVAAG